MGSQVVGISAWLPPAGARAQPLRGDRRDSAPTGTARRRRRRGDGRVAARRAATKFKHARFAESPRLGRGEEPSTRLCQAEPQRRHPARDPVSEHIGSALPLACIGQRPPYTVQRMLTLASQVEVLARLGRALADPTRCRILLALLDGPAHPAELAAKLALTRSNVSNHLACLRGCGLVVANPSGRQTQYEISDPHLADALTGLLNVALVADAACPPGPPRPTGSGRAQVERHR